MAPVFALRCRLAFNPARRKAMAKMSVKGLCSASANSYWKILVCPECVYGRIRGNETGDQIVKVSCLFDPKHDFYFTTIRGFSFIAAD